MSPEKRMIVLLFLLYGLLPRCTADVRLDMCDKQGFLEGFPFTVRCYTDSPDSEVIWSLITDSGKTLDLGSCSGIGRCQSNEAPNVQLERYGLPEVFSSARFQKAVWETAGTLTCSENYEGETTTDSCTLRVTSAKLMCPENGFETQVKGSAMMHCDVSNSSLPITWTLVTLALKAIDLVTCYNKNNCSSGPDYITVDRHIDTQSRLTFRNTKMEMAGTIVCTDGSSVSNCSQDICLPSPPESCSLQLHADNWTAEVKCRVKGIQSVLANFGFLVQQNLRQQTGDLSFKTTVQLLSAKRLPLTLSPYTDNSNGEGYYRGNWAYSWPLPTQNGLYFYHVYTYPGGQALQIPESLFIENPTPPTVSCRDLVRAPCVCSTPSVGRPAGRLVWLSGNTVLAAGEYGIKELQLPSSVTVDEREQELTCQLDWIVRYNVGTKAPRAPQGAADETSGSSVMLVVAVAGYVVLGAVLVAAVVVTVIFFRRMRASKPSQKEVPQPTPEDPHTYCQIAYLTPTPA